MKICIIIHTKTGTTRTFADQIAAELRTRNHKVDIVALQIAGEVQIGNENVNVRNIPDCSNYDAVFVGCPVWGFTATPVAITCIKKLIGIKGKTFAPFVTMGFPFAAMGGKQALARLSNLAAASGAKVQAGSIIPKMFHNYREHMKREAVRLAGLF